MCMQTPVRSALHNPIPAISTSRCSCNHVSDLPSCVKFRFGGTRTTSEQFNCAGRTIKTGPQRSPQPQLLKTNLILAAEECGLYQGLNECFKAVLNADLIVPVLLAAGLIAVDIVSHWTWAATLLQSSNVAWEYGVSGPFWCARLLHTARCNAQDMCRCL